MSTNIKITIAESSSIIRCGLETLLKRLPGFRIQISEITAADLSLIHISEPTRP